MLLGKRDWPKIGHGKRDWEKNGIRDSDDKCSGSGMVVKRNGTAESGTPFPDPILTIESFSSVGNSLRRQNALTLNKN